MYLREPSDWTIPAGAVDQKFGSLKLGISCPPENASFPPRAAPVKRQQCVFSFTAVGDKSALPPTPLMALRCPRVCEGGHKATAEEKHVGPHLICLWPSSFASSRDRPETQLAPTAPRLPPIGRRFVNPRSLDRPARAGQVPAGRSSSSTGS